MESRGTSKVIEDVPLYLARCPSLLHHIQRQSTAVQDLVRVWDPNFGPEGQENIAKLVKAADTNNLLAKKKTNVIASITNVLPQRYRDNFSTWARLHKHAFLQVLTAIPEQTEYEPAWAPLSQGDYETL